MEDKPNPCPACHWPLWIDHEQYPLVCEVLRKSKAKPVRNNLAIVLGRTEVSDPRQFDLFTDHKEIRPSDFE